LRAALESGTLPRRLRCLHDEPAKESVLFGAPNFVATPHLGASTNEAQENVALQVAEQISDYLLTGAVTNALNMAAISARTRRASNRSSDSSTSSVVCRSDCGRGHRGGRNRI